MNTSNPSNSALYMIYVNPSHRITMGGRDISVTLKMLKMFPNDEYIEQVKKLCTSISKDEDIQFIGEYTDQNEDISLVFIQNPSKLIDEAKKQLNKNGQQHEVVQITFSNDVEKDQLICIRIPSKEWREGTTPKKADTRIEIDEESPDNEEIILENYPCEYVVGLPFESYWNRSSTQNSPPISV